MSQAASPARKTSIRRRPTARVRAPSSPARRVDIHPLDRAIAELRRELARSPNDATLYGRLGALHYRRSDLREAERCFRRAATLQPGRATYLNNLGNVLADLGDLKAGLSCYEKALEVEKAARPGVEPSPEVTTNLELARLEYRIVHERIEYLERAVKLEVGSAEAYNALGGGYLLRGERERALSAFRKAAALEPQNVEAALNVGFAHALELNGPSDLNGELAELAESAVRFPEQARLFLHQGELLETAGLLEEAEARYVRAVRADPRCLEACEVLGRLRELLGTADARDGTARQVGEALERLEREAAEAEKLPARRAAALLDLALAEVARARFARRTLDASALDRRLREALRMAGAADARTDAAAAALRARLLEDDGRRDEAALVLDQACERRPDAARLWFERGALALRQGQIALAVDAFERATLAAPQDACAYHSLRFALEGYRRYRTERVRYEAAMRENPRDAAAHHHLALAAFSVLKDEEALFHFGRALELEPRLTEAACGRGRALQRQGHLAEARQAYRQALKLDAECAEARRALALLDALANDSRA
ncbi:MAG: tetratricopeptide repeat protein [Planctomycetota bacterium]|nr:tetratricopeptide repeat protein [Planctomycetota bacterium]